MLTSIVCVLNAPLPIPGVSQGFLPLKKNTLPSFYFYIFLPPIPIPGVSESSLPGGQIYKNIISIIFMISMKQKK